MPQFRPWSVVLAVALLCHAAPAWPSGVTRMPETSRKMENFRACFAFLKARAAEDAARVVPMTLDPNGDGKFVSVERRSDGIERTGKASARYAARIWYGFDRPRPEIGQIETSSGWEEHDYQCHGRTLISNMSQGYALSGFQPMAREDELTAPSPNDE